MELLTRYGDKPLFANDPHHAWEAGAAFNPNVLYNNGLTRMVYRATPVDGSHGSFKIGQYMSSAGYAISYDGINFQRFQDPLLTFDQPYEAGMGCEDPRVQKIEDTYYLHYTAVGEKDGEAVVRIAVASSPDFKTWTKHGIVGPDVPSKAATLFPRAINGKYHMLYALNPDHRGSSIMDVELDSSTDLTNPPKGLMEESVKNYDEHVVFRPSEGARRGPEVGAPPIETDEGWLMVYCPENMTDHDEWTIGAALLDLQEPKRVLAKTQEPLLRAKRDYELNGPVCKNAVFPMGAVIFDNTLFVYHGSGDNGVCLSTGYLDNVMNSMEAA